MLAFTAAFLTGVVIPTTWSWLPPWWIFFIFALITLGFAKRYSTYRFSLGIVIATLIGVGWCCYRATRLQLILSQDYFAKPVVVSARIASIPEYRTGRLQFECLVCNVNNRTVKPFRMLFAQYDTRQSSLLKANLGESWQFTVRLKKPRGFWNIGSFDQQAWLLQREIVALGTLVSSNQTIASAKLLKHPKRVRFFYNTTKCIHAIRLRLSTYLQANTSEQRYLGLLEALTVGMRHNIQPRQWEVMQSTGTSHLFSISGLHIGFVSGICYSLVRLLWSFSRRLCLWIPSKQAAYCGSWLGALSYSAISGLSLFVQRALIMFSVFVVTILRRRMLPPWQSWCIALLIILTINPFVVLGASFWLSFGALAIIFYGLGARLRINAKDVTTYQKIKAAWVSNQWIISTGLIPLSLWFFQQLSLSGFIANLVAIPWVGFVVLPFSLLGVMLYPISPAKIGLLITFSDKAIGWLWHFLDYLTTFPLSHYFLVIPNRWILLGTSLSTCLLIAPKGFPSRYYLAGISCLPILLWSSPAPLRNEFWLTVFDVGQGLAVLVRTHKHVLIYDTGPRFGGSSDASNQVIIPYLRTLGIRKIDTLIISHGDSDHSGGAQTLLKSTPVKRVLTSDINRLNIKQSCACYKGQQWEWDGVYFNILHPLNHHTLKGNDASCVLKISNTAHQCLLPGDIHRQGEKLLLANNPSLKVITALVAPHHGSKTSSSSAFVKRILPKFVIFPVGYRNRFKFPHASVIQQYKNHQAQLHSTAEEGMITIKFSNSLNAPTIHSFIQKNKRFWHTPLKK